MKLNEMSESLSESLLDRLSDLRTDIAEMAQVIYDDWDQEDDNNEYGNGGICDTISTGIGDILAANDIEATEGGHEGDDHSYMVAYDEQSAYIINIPSYIYETGAGYNWTKLGGIQITPDDVEISTTEMPDWI